MRQHVLMPITPQLHAAREAKKAAGGRLGGPAPYGYRWQAGKFAPIEEEQHVLWLMRHLATLPGWTFQRIADQLHALDLAPRSGGRWRRDAIHRIVRRDLPDTG